MSKEDNVVKADNRANGKAHKKNQRTALVQNLLIIDLHWYNTN